ncbi:tetratricopeptide repeat protein [Kingella negevensis]|uniref:O-linked N-acetylglucosamine transferase, SPINDLY family protein n=2 Tax=Kingella negevensis TaxID=1522312 RepID=UPI002542BCAD|nr:tetratricopeptide repeat protein [Kingella negevensis]MDK4679559.1 tetratricopeptide repeat protein [Kingella negevensis]MDK4682723.1 tetratricopeptide repeat protein [Kingella negevensis]MDK4690920.1 tetratricopeptide repeat protein [Kingella negevensis]MDK4693933.1 tetratricopeptide repeat protein [Kingella negevensis]MDK4699662.1 tetratricopeptide repeat protein [Kingella negevensis]
MTTPTYSEIFHLYEQRQFPEVLAACELFLRENPNHSEILNIQAVSFCEQEQYEQGIAAWLAIPQNEHIVGIQSNLGATYIRLKQYDLARKHLLRAIELNPHSAHVLYNMAFLCKETQSNPAETLRYLRATLKEDPAFVHALENFVFYEYFAEQPDLVAIREAAKQYAAYLTQKTTAWRSLKTVQAVNPNKRLKIGIVSADIHHHPVGHFFASLLESQAANEYDWTAYHNTHHFDDLTERVRQKFTHWHTIDQWTDEQLAQQIQANEIDVLIDLSGYTDRHRLAVFAARVAPVQISWLGYWGTTGLPTMNALIADPYCVPPEEEPFYTEQIWRMPQTRLCMGTPNEGGSVVPLPALKNGYITFGCFQNVLKINESVLKTWAKIAFRLPENHWFFKSSSVAPNSPYLEAFKQKLVQHGFNLNHVHFENVSLREDYFAAYHKIDLVLDTFPYSSGAKTCDALWQGVPTLTLTQSGMLARQGEQLLRAAQLGDWVCRSADEYVKKAIEWASPTRWGQLNAMRLGLREHVKQTPIFDNETFGRDWVDLVRQIWHDACRKNAA